MEAVRSLPEEKLKNVTEPHMLSCSAMLSLTSGMLAAIGAKGRTAITFSNRSDFANVLTITTNTLQVAIR
jgi:hypothetical protein